MFLVQYFSVYKMFSLPLSPISLRGFDHVIYVICILLSITIAMSIFCVVCIAQSIVFCAVFGRLLFFVLHFLLTIYCLFSFDLKNSDYPFDIFILL